MTHEERNVSRFLLGNHGSEQTPERLHERWYEEESDEPEDSRRWDGTKSRKAPSFYKRQIRSCPHSVIQRRQTIPQSGTLEFHRESCNFRGNPTKFQRSKSCLTSITWVDQELIYDPEHGEDLGPRTITIRLLATDDYTTRPTEIFFFDCD